MDKPVFTKAKHFFLELFFPSFCLGCSKEGVLLCYDCRSILEISEYHYCLCGNNPLRLPPESRQGKCSRCQDKKLTGLYSALSYKEKFLTRKLIRQFKYEPYYLKTLSKTLADILLEHLFLAKKLTPEIWEKSIIIPVPLEKGKWKDRGYNQSELLGQEIGQALNVPLLLGNLIKIKKTDSQMKLKAKDREENVREAFKVKNPVEFAGKKVFLVDDVYTTGSTMEECARVLRNAGAKSVWGIIVAREG